MVVAIVIALHPGRSVAAHAGMAGEPDPEFGGDGIVTTDLAGLEDAADGVAIQPDGKLVVAGGSGTDFAVVRYHPDGAVDTGFGRGGTAGTDFAGGVD